MGCVTLTKSRKLACTSKIAGVVAIGIAPYDSLNRVVTTATGVIALPAGMGIGSIARLELKNAATKYLENGVTGGDNRSTGVTGSITCTFNVPVGQDIADALMVEQLMKGESVLFIEKKDGTIVVAGSQLGALAITADGDTGGTIGDLNGYTVTFQTMEPDFSRKYLLTGAGLTAYATALMPYV
jgi:hypothetical protein